MTFGGPVRPTPQPAFSVFDLLSMVDWKDVAGRPLGEVRASATAKEGVVFTRKTTQYEGVRLGKQINISALEQVTRNKSDIFALLRGLRTVFVKPDERTTINQLIRITKAGESLPAYLRYQQGITDRTITESVAGAMKASAGVASAAHSLRFDEFSRVKELTASEFLKYAEYKRLLVGNSGEACAAPSNLIIEALNVLLEPSDEHSTNIESLVGDLKVFKKFVDEQIQLATIIQGYIARSQDCLDVFNQVAGLFNDSVLAQYLQHMSLEQLKEDATHDFELAVGDYLYAESLAVDQFTAAQQRLARILGIKGKTAEITAQDVRREISSTPYEKICAFFGGEPAPMVARRLINRAKSERRKQS